METFESIRNRRSIRAFTDEIPHTAAVARVLDAGRWAPSGLNNQPWRFMVIRDRKARESLAQFTKYSGIIVEAPVSIVLCLDLDKSYNRDKDVMAVGASIQNMLLAAFSLGLGTCWLGEIINRKDEIARWLGLDESLEIMAVIALGYPRGPSGEGERRPLEEIVIGRLE